MKPKLKPIIAGLSLACLLPSCHREKMFTLEIKDGVRIIHNLRPKVDNPRSSLEFVLQIGELEPEDENYLFVRPLSATEDHEGNIFILDSQEGCIKKFTSGGTYIMEFGREGQGPGEFQFPMQIDSRSGQLLVTSLAAQFHIFDLDGQFIKKFDLPRYHGIGMKLMDSDEAVGCSLGIRHDNSKENLILKIYDTEGNIEHEFGEPFLLATALKSGSANWNSITVDDDDNIFLAFHFQNRIDKYSENGDLLLKISRELPFELEYRSRKEDMEIQGRVVEVDRDRFSLVSRGLGVDSEGRIWVLSTKKQFPWDQDSEEARIQEYFHFDVFNDEGILLATLPFPERIESFDDMTMDGDHIYFADPYGQACVYKYRVVWRD